VIAIGISGAWDIPAGRKRDFAALEARRLDAVAPGHGAGGHRARARRPIDGRWLAGPARRRGAGAALKHAGRAGREPPLTAADSQRIERALQRGPETLGYATPLRTAERVTRLIEQECGMRYHPGHVWAARASWTGPANARVPPRAPRSP